MNPHTDSFSGNYSFDQYFLFCQTMLIFLGLKKLCFKKIYQGKLLEALKWQQGDSLKFNSCMRQYYTEKNEIIAAVWSINRGHMGLNCLSKVYSFRFEVI